MSYTVALTVTSATITALVRRWGKWHTETTVLDGSHISPDGRLRLTADKDLIIQDITLHFGNVGVMNVIVDEQIKADRGDRVSIDIVPPT
jgi:hypothetical protein